MPDRACPALLVGSARGDGTLSSSMPADEEDAESFGAGAPSAETEGSPWHKIAPANPDHTKRRHPHTPTARSRCFGCPTNPLTSEPSFLIIAPAFPTYGPQTLAGFAGPRPAHRPRPGQADHANAAWPEHLPITRPTLSCHIVGLPYRGAEANHAVRETTGQAAASWAPEGLILVLAVFSLIAGLLWSAAY